MAEFSKIEWTTHTFNPWEGCTKVSPGCENCYAEERAKRFRTVKWGPEGTRRIASEAYWKKPLAWNREAIVAGERHRVFCASLADVFEDREELRAPRVRLLCLIALTPDLDWLLLTKRPQNIRRLLTQALEDIIANPSLVHWPIVLTHFLKAWLQGTAPHNVWLGTSVEDELRTRRIYDLTEMKAKVHFLSLEPLLGPLDFTDGPLDRANSTMGSWSMLTGIEWVIIGGESGRHARPCELEWIRSIVKQCRAEGVPVFVKQLGSRPSATLQPSLRLLDRKGGDMDEWPEDLRIREFPIACLTRGGSHEPG